MGRDKVRCLLWEYIPLVLKDKEAMSGSHEHRHKTGVSDWSAQYVSTSDEK